MEKRRERFGDSRVDPGARGSRATGSTSLYIRNIKLTYQNLHTKMLMLPRYLINLIVAFLIVVQINFKQF